MALQNGRLPQSLLAPVGDGYFLERGAADAFNAMSAEARRRYGTPILLNAGYRSLDRQRYFWNLYQAGLGNLAAYPGTSNHGVGLAIDLRNPRMRWIIDQLGAKYGWSKSWSDASGEWWHILYSRSHDKHRSKATNNPKTLRQGMNGKSVEKLQRLLREHGYKSVAVTGFYGEATRKAVWRFQKKRGLKPDGVAGPKTLKALGWR